MWHAENWSRKAKEGFRKCHSSSYTNGRVALEDGVVDLHIGTILNINSSALEVACPPPGVGAKKIQQSSLKSFGITYMGGSVALDCGVMDLHIGPMIGSNSSTLEVAFGPPGFGAKS
jgi:hypothetical protein